MLQKFMSVTDIISKNSEPYILSLQRFGSHFCGATLVSSSESIILLIQGYKGFKRSRWERLCVIVIAQRSSEKRTVITTNNDDDVCLHQLITIFDFLTFIFCYLMSNLMLNICLRKHHKLFSNLLSKLYI